jgi:hypothetical protein
MMTPQQEARDLIDQPLPPLAEDLVDLPTYATWWMPTHIYEIDSMIEELERDLKAARETREKMLEMAVDNKVLEDEHCLISFRERRTRILDIGRFKAACPGQFNAAVLIIQNRLEALAATAEEQITLGLADQVAGKDRVDAVCEIVVTRTPFVALKHQGGS